jgi:outer membrane protein TolC
MLRFYDTTLRWSLKHSFLILLVLLGSTTLNFYLFNVVPKGFFPQQDSGTLLGGVQADPAISFQLMRKKLEQIQTIVQNDPAVDSVVTNTGGRLEGTATWEPDVWGKIRRNVERSLASAQASAAQLAAAKLSVQAQLATNYFQLRCADSLKSLLDDTARAYQHALDITKNQYAAGTAARSDVVNAEAQLLAAQAAAINVGVQRAQDEHAIALLVGKPPAEVSIPPASLAERVPIVPTNVSSTLLERRPDIAEAERQMQQENALIGTMMTP